MSQSNIDVTTEIFSRFGAKDIPGILQLLDDEVRIEFYGPPAIPYAGFYQGKARAGEFFATVLASVDIHQFDAEELLSDGDKVIVTGKLRLTARPTGREIKSDFVHVITLRGGKWLLFRDFMNTAVAAAAFAA
jgi:ketosteroid isomerase-like protein